MKLTQKSNRKQLYTDDNDDDLAIDAIVVPLQTAVPYLMKDQKVTYKRKKLKNFNEIEGKEREGQQCCLRKRKKKPNAKFKLLKKEKVI